MQQPQQQLQRQYLPSVSMFPGHTSQTYLLRRSHKHRVKARALGQQVCSRGRRQFLQTRGTRADAEDHSVAHQSSRGLHATAAVAGACQSRCKLAEMQIFAGLDATCRTRTLARLEHWLTECRLHDAHADGHASSIHGSLNVQVHDAVLCMIGHIQYTRHTLATDNHI